MIIIQARLKDNGKWNKSLQTIATEMKWSTCKECKDQSEAEKVLTGLLKGSTYYEYRLKPNGEREKI